MTSKSPERFLELAAVEMELSVKKCIYLPTIKEFSSEYGIKETLRSIRQLILNTSKMFKNSDNMEIDVATKLTTDLYEYFKHESMEDVALLLKMARTGQLGTGYGRLDSNTLFSIFVPKYLELKADEREREHNRNKQNFAQVKMSEESFEKFDELSKKLKGRHEKKMAEEALPVVNHHQMYLNKIKAAIPSMNEMQLKDNLRNLQAADQEVFKSAAELFEKEIEKRSKDAQNKEAES